MSWSEPVKALMSTDPVSIDVDARPSDVQKILANHAFHHVPVLDHGLLVGVVSALDLARVSFGAWVDAETQGAWIDERFKVSDLMTFEPEFVRDDDTLRTAADKLSEGSFHALPVLDHANRLVGMLTSTDLLRYMAAR